MGTQTLRRLKLSVSLLAVLGALSVAGLALAQASTRYDLGCWSVYTGGGGQRQSASVQILDVAGLWAGGQSSSPNIVLHSGYEQNWSLHIAPSPEPSPSPAANYKHNFFMPQIFKSIRIVRTCADQ